MYLVMRAQGEPAALASAARAAVASLDRSLPLAHLQTMDQVLGKTLEPRRFNTILLGAFACVALLLAMLGIHGVIAYSVTQRTQEIGIRMALGASRNDVLRIVLREGLMLALVGIGIGAVASLLLTQYLRSLLYGVTPTDPATFTAVALLLAAAAIGSAWLPAYRAMKIEPLRALRQE
jgi:putative ABC transport system permease protein